MLQDGVDSMEAMEKALKFVLLWGGILAVILIPIWPLLALAAGTFSQGQLKCRQLISAQPVACHFNTGHDLAQHGTT